jgi:1-deoxy-D-xylulose-5-phosphate synthase
MFNEIPTSRPETPLLDTIETPDQLRHLPSEQLAQLAGELRHFLLYTVGKTGGHFGAGLGVVELTIALHYIFDTPNDTLIWDVGHQTYPHKILTGRRELMQTLRRPEGIAPFPTPLESRFDPFATGHSSTSISAALGIELANQVNSVDSRTLVVIGDGAMTAGMAFEALNHVAACHADVLVVLNDNAMSISENVGGLANYFARNISASDLGVGVDHPASAPGSIFTDLGFSYTGPIDGHDLNALTENLNHLKDQRGPRLLHVITKKGKGYAPAEQSPVASHALTKLEKQGTNRSSTYSNAFGDWLCAAAEKDHKLVAITPAMKEGSDLIRFAEVFPERFHDVAIAEQHAVTLAAGLAIGGAKPVVAIYSTFLQRAYDQLIHDVAIQNLDVLFAVDRASLLEDGPTHSGVFDLSFTRAIPNLIVMTPATQDEMLAMLDFGYRYPGPCLVRYPRGAALIEGTKQPEIQIGKANQLRNGSDVALLSFGAMKPEAEELANRHQYTLVDMRFVKPIDSELIERLAATHRLLVTIEENAIAGGAGSAVNETISRLDIETRILNLGVPDRFIDQDDPDSMKAAADISVEKMEAAILARL